MAKYLPLFCFFIWATHFPACSEKRIPEDPTVWKKVHIDFRKLDANGLMGPANGKVAVNYEFCIPAQGKYWQQIQKIDPTAVKMEGSKGRIACTKEQWLVVGNTHRSNYMQVLYDLAALPYIDKIDPTYWE